MLNDLEQKVTSLIDSNRDEIISYLSDLIAFPTITPPLATEDSIDRTPHQQYQKQMEFILRELGCEITTWEIRADELEQGEGFGVIPDRDLSCMPVVVGTLKGQGGGGSLILNGHYDVVDPGSLSEWSSDPFKLEIKDENLYGRGVCDMKGGIAAMIKALDFIKRAGVRIKGDITVESVPDEEGSLMGTLSCCQRGYRADAALIPEPTNFNTLVAMRGYLAGKIMVRGRAGHAEFTQPHWKEGGAVNAISKLVKVMQALEDLNEKWRTAPETQHPLLDPNHIVPTIIKGGTWPISYPDKAEFEFTSNFIPGTEDDIRIEIEKRLQWVAEGDDWLKSHPPQMEAFWAYGGEIDPRTPVAQTAMNVAADMGIVSKPTGMGSLTDGVHLINYAKVPTICVGPSDKTAHATNECIGIIELIQLTQLFAVFVMRWCGYVKP